MNDRRLDPDILLERVTAEERKRGRLKIYLGMAAGAGKTYAMLTDALIEKRRGVKILAGYIEPHGRVETEQLITELDQLSFRIVDHRGVSVREFDLDAALDKHPQILLVDELAHTNAPGSRHAKRWQDIEECLKHGINVFTTLNVQHIESVTDVVTKVTGTPIYETVPDSVVRQADEIELIDVTPEELIQRLKDGKVYVPDKVETALAHFFRPGSLLALRELVLRITAERVDDQLSTFRRLHDVREIWPVKPRVLVCVSPNFFSERVVRTASRLASAIHTELIAVSVDRPSCSNMGGLREKLVQDSLDLAKELGAEINRIVGEDVVTEILRVAREKNANIIVMGKPVRSRIREYLYGSIVDDLIRRSGDLDVYVITGTVNDEKAYHPFQISTPSFKGLISAFSVSGIATAVSFLAYPFLELSNLVMFYLLGVAWAGSKLGRSESILTCILSVLAFDFFFVPPRWTFVVSNMQYVVTFAVMLIIALLISTLTTRLKIQSELVDERERRTSLLYEVSKRLASATSIPQIALIVKEKSFELFGCEGIIFIPDSEENVKTLVLSDIAIEDNQNELAVVKWVATHKSYAGAGTDTLSGSKGQYIPLLASRSVSAVLGIYYADGKIQTPSDPLVEAFVTQVGSALERVMVEHESTNIQVEIERERVRNLLLSSISHDFRSPLAAISGAADTLTQRQSVQDAQSKELVVSIKDQASRLSRLVRNVLDLTRLEAGEIPLKIEWESVEELVGTALEHTSVLLGERAIDIRLPKDLPLIQVDATLIEQVFVNLLENIAKHTSKDSHVIIRAYTQVDRLFIEFSDNGPGLPVAYLSQIFEKSFRGSTTTEGFGLGLTICRAVMRAHKGDIVAANNEGRGARFTLILPLPEAQPEVNYGR